MPHNHDRLQSSWPTVDFTRMVDAIRQVHESCTYASQAVNVRLTLRNWTIGCYIRDYEQNGANRFKYGEETSRKPLRSPQGKGRRNMAARSLR